MVFFVIKKVETFYQPLYECNKVAEMEAKAASVNTSESFDKLCSNISIFISLSNLFSSLAVVYLVNKLSSRNKQKTQFKTKKGLLPKK